MQEDSFFFIACATFARYMLPLILLKFFAEKGLQNLPPIQSNSSHLNQISNTSMY